MQDGFKMDQNEEPYKNQQLHEIENHVTTRNRNPVRWRKWGLDQEIIRENGTTKNESGKQIASRRTQKCVCHQIEKQILRVESKSRVKEHQSSSREEIKMG